MCPSAIMCLQCTLNRVKSSTKSCSHRNHRPRIPLKYAWHRTPSAFDRTSVNNRQFCQLILDSNMLIMLFHTNIMPQKIPCNKTLTTLWDNNGQALNPARPVPARPTSLKTVLARPKIRPGQEDVKKPATADQRRPASAIA